MSRWTVGSRIPQIARNPKHLLRFQSPSSCNNPDQRRRQHGLGVTRLFKESVASFSNAFQPFDKIPHRDHNTETMRFYDVLNLVKVSSLKPHIVNTKIVHSMAFKVGALSHLPTSTTLLTVYSRAGDFGSSMEFFDEVVHKDVIFWNAMMTACIKNGRFDAAIDFFAQMMEMRSGYDSATLVIAISALTNLKLLRQGRVLHGLGVTAGMLSDSFLGNAVVDMYAKCGDLSSSERMFKAVLCRDVISWNSVIRGCLYNNKPEKSLQYFKMMVSSGEQADGTSLSCTIAASNSLGESGFGQVVHGWSVKVGCESHVSVANATIALHFQCGDVNAAKTVFRRMAHRDVISWNSMIDGFASNGLVSETFDILKQMQSAGSVQPDIVTVVTIIPLCAELMLFKEGRSVHGFAIRRDMRSDLSVVNSLMNFYLKCYDIKAAEYLFNTMPNKDLVSWNTLISGYSQNGHTREAQVLFKELLYRCSQCSLSTLLAILPSCCSPQSLHLGRSLHCWQLKSGFLDDRLAIGSLLFMYIKGEDLTSSWALLLQVSAKADTACWNTVIAGCTQNSHFWTALKTFHLMRKSLARYDSITLVNVITACGNLVLSLEGKLLHGLSIKTSEGTDIRVQNALVTMYGRLGEVEIAYMVFRLCGNRNLCSWNCMISAFTQNKEGKRALEAFSSLDHVPNEITISSVLSACTQLGLMRLGKEIHCYVFRFGLENNSFISAALVDMYSNCGRLEISLQVFENLPEKSVAAWNSMISAFGFHNYGQKAIELFNEMIGSGTNPTKSTFISLLSTCSHSRLVDEGKGYYNRMLDEFGVEPVIEHRVCVVDMLGRSGRLQEAREFIEQISPRPESGVWGALLSACNYHGDLEMGREVAEILFKLEPSNVGYHVSLFNMYVAAGRWSEAVECRRKLQDKRLKKTAGLSLIDLGSG